MTKVNALDQANAIARLKGIVEPGDTVYSILRHVSRSGMYRVISLYAIKDNQPVCLDGYASYLLSGYDTRHDGLKAHGCGMDMGFSLVYDLAAILFGYENRGGYALNQKWM